MKEVQKYYYERLSEENFHQFYLLHKKVFNPKKDITVLKNKYTNHHIIPGYFGFLALEKATNEAVSYFGAIPWLVRKGDEQILVAQGADIMTLPKYRGLGLIQYLHQLLIPLLKKNGFYFLFAFANQSSLPVVSKKLNWSIYGGLKNFVYKSELVIPIRKIAFKFPLLRKLHDSMIDNIFKRYETELPDVLLDNNIPAGTLRNSEFYHYKLISGRKIIHIGSSYFIIKFTNHLTIGDFYINDLSQFAQDLRQLIQLTKKCGISHIYFLTNSQKKSELLSPLFTFTNNILALALIEFQQSEINYEELVFSSIDMDSF